MTDDTDDADPEATLREWKESMEAEHEDAIANPDPDADHRIEGVAQVNYRLSYDLDAETETLERSDEQQVNELTDPEHLSCLCGVRGMSRAEAERHLTAARE